MKSTETQVRRIAIVQAFEALKMEGAALVKAFDDGGSSRAGIVTGPTMRVVDMMAPGLPDSEWRNTLKLVLDAR